MVTLDALQGPCLPTSTPPARPPVLELRRTSWLLLRALGRI